MKKLLIVAVLAIFTATTAFEKPLTTDGIKIKNEFSKSFDGIENVIWVSTEKFTAAIFSLNGVQVKAFYSNEGDYLGTSKTFAYNKLPAKALETISAKYAYPQYNLKDCIEYKTADGEVNYYISFEKNNKTLVVEVSPAGSVEFIKTI